jgi:hypothetical protein
MQNSSEDANPLSKPRSTDLTVPRIPPIGCDLASFSVPMPQALASFNHANDSNSCTAEDLVGVTWHLL